MNENLYIPMRKYCTKVQGFIVILMLGPGLMLALTSHFKILQLLYFFGYKTELFSFQNNPRDLDPSYKTDLDL